ncbi:protein dopey-1 homolog [Macrosteles quadrilineatus]|uniref:protein dopey-1 homolog n=1 Tax=Macrosteles quadrilineatus TaxID=74068 RepID=UPI0023E1C755|nr:protein dopey-1 homolog [Macrosteles quadrilineatus]
MGTIALEEYELMKDSKYRVYVSAVDKALKSFEYTSEWADLISALGKLNKVLISHTKFPVIPRRIKISKRLAQCMHPALPSGVHLKALETYDIIFKCMGTNRLSHELFIYSAGLFPLLGHAAMNVRPSLLTVYETHFVPLGERLGPGLSGFLSGVLPGLEEGSDHFERTNSLLEKVCEGVGASLFYGCLWDCLASNAAVRLPAILFVFTHYDRRLSTEDQLHIMGTNIDIMIEGLCACVHDTSVLVQRSALDLLLIGFPMHNSQLVKSDMTRLVTASLATILRRDMSLNRRLYAWLLGSEVNISLLSSEHPLVKKCKSSESLASSNLANLYFEMYSREMLVQAIKNVLSEATGQNPHDLRPYRLLVSLLDKVDIGPVILDDILFEVFRLLYLCCSGSTKSNSVELFKSANLLFSSLEPKYMWQYCGQLVASACGRTHNSDSESSPVHQVGSGDPGLVEVCALTEFLLDTVSLETYSDTPSEHLPALFLHIVTLLTDHCDMLSPLQTARALQLCAKILTRVQPTITSHQQRDSEDQQKDGTGTDTTSISDTASQSSHTSVATTSPATAAVSSHHSVLEQCLRQYEKFYVTFVYGTRLKVGETKSISVLLETLRIKSNQTSYEERAKQLETLLRAVLDDKGGGRPAVGEGELDVAPIFMSGRRVGGVAGLEWAPAMTVASRLLVDLSTLQTFFQAPSANNILDQNNPEMESSIDILPEWLRVLIVCACWLHSSTSLQMIAISTLLDLVTLCRTAQSLVASSNTDHQSVTTVLILPLLTPAHLRYMENHTNIFQVIAHWLWGQLHSTVAAERVRSVELLHQLQSALASSDVVEDCVGEALMAHSSGSKLEAFRTFATLWHIGREVNARLGNSLRVTDIFYKSMLKMLDNLQLPDSSALKVEAQNWLLHSLLRGDIHRLLDPIMMMLLDPATARVSVLHVRIQQHDETSQTDTANADDKTPRIYAISSVDGNVIYHVSEKSETKPGKAKRVFAVQTKLAGQDSSKLNSKFVTEKKATLKTDDMGDPYQAHSKNLNLLQNISVFVNPFSREGAHKIEAINTDFDDYYEEQKEQNGDLIGKAVRITATDLDKNKSKSTEGSNRLVSGDEKRKNGNLKVQRNNSLTSLDTEFARSDSNQTTKSSIDLLQLSSLSDTIFTKVSDGESLIEKARNGRGSVSSEGLATAASGDGNGELVRSWSFPGKDSDSCEPDESASAEDYFKAPNMSEACAVVEEVVNDLLDRVAALSGEVEIVKESSSSEPSLRSNSMSTPRAPRRHLQYRASLTSGPVDHLHSHLLLYCGVYDSQRALYALHTVRNMLATNARAFLCSSSTTGLVSRSPLLKLVSRHRKSIFGRGFLGELDASSTRSCMYVEVIITTCMYYMRSFYPNLGQNKLTADEIHANRQVQISSVELLSLVCYELTAIVRDSGRGLACYLNDLLSRIKLQKITLHCVLTSIPTSAKALRSFTHEILTFNENTDESLANQSEAFQVQILRFLLSLIMLEHEVNQRKGEGEETKHESHSNGELRYVTGRPLPQQPMLLTAILRALEAPGRASYAHTHWTALVTCALPYLGSSLTKVVTAVVRQLCANVEQLSRAYDPVVADSVSMPADYAITQVEALTVLCHYCLLDTATPFTSPLGGTSTPAQIFNNLIHVFMPSPLLMNKEKPEPQASARKAVLSNLPRVIASVAVLWHALTQRKERESENCEAGSARVVRQQLLEFLSPIALHHGTSFLAAMAVVWRERRPTTLQTNYTVMSPASEGQQVLVQLLSAIKAMPIDTLVQTLHQVVKQPAMNQQTAMSVEVSALELFHHYLQLVAGVSLAESWGSLLSLLREGPSLSAPAQFLLVGVLSQFVHRCPPLQDKKDHRDLQDITAKLVESCSQIAGANLEQTTWLRRNLAVKEEEIPQPPSPECADKYEEIESEPVVNGIDNLTSYDVSLSPAKKNKSKSKLKRVTKKIRQDAEKLQIRALHQWFSRSFVHEGNFPVDTESLRNSPGTTSVAQYSVTALTVLAQMLAPLLDVTYGSQEKERVVALLTALMYNVTPYLKNHTQRNAASFYACSQLVASLSGFQYTRKAWRKDVMDLLLDPALFQMETRTLAYWRTIVDNLMSQDTATFRDLMSRVSMSQGNSLSLFSSREQEYEQRAQLLKRLAFVILCSEKDQFHKHTPDIQERLAESLRLPQVVPGVQSQVFLCFRVLLLRMSPHHVTSLWPIIVSEVVQVMLHMEHDLSTDTEEFRRNNSSHIRLLSALDLSWVVNSNNGLHANGHPHWLQLQLAAAKLLYLAVHLPADTLPQFQMYRWAFVSPKCSTSSSQVNADFVPHVTRIARLMDVKFGGAPEKLPSPLLPPGSSIRALSDLHPFFTVMSSGHFTPLSLAELETDIEQDFLEPMPPR